MMNLAILIDAENMSAAIAPELFEKKIPLLGNAIIRRAYGNWDSPHLQAWKNVLPDFVVRPVQQFACASGKNASDIAMVVDAMDLLYNRSDIDRFVIVSSDSDFTPLVMYLREHRKLVYGFGKENASESLKKACHKFEVLERALNDQSEDSKVIVKPAEVKPPKAPAKTPAKTAAKKTAATSKSVTSKRYTAQELQQDKNLIPKIKDAVNALKDKADDSGYINLSRIATKLKELGINQKQPYGYAKVIDFLKAVGIFEFKQNNKAYALKLKK